MVAPQARLTCSAIGWATDALDHDDTTVSALAPDLGVDWHTLWDAVEVEATLPVADPACLAGVRTLGFDWVPACGAHTSGDRAGSGPQPGP